MSEKCEMRKCEMLIPLVFRFFRVSHLLPLGEGLRCIVIADYDPSLGVFASLDPLETANRYAYVGGNPINYKDASGMYRIPTPGDFIEGCQTDDNEDDCGCPPGLSGVACRRDCAQAPCDRVRFLKDHSDVIASSDLVDAARNAGIDPILVGILIENEWSNAWVRRENDLGAGTVRGLAGENPSLGIAQIQQNNALQVILNNPDVFPNYQNFNANDVGDLIHENPLVSIQIATYFTASLREQILSDLQREVGITLGTGECFTEVACTISERQLEDLVILAYRQGWVNNQCGIYNLLKGTDYPECQRAGRDGAVDWFNGIKLTIANDNNANQIRKVRSHEDNLDACLRGG